MFCSRDTRFDERLQEKDTDLSYLDLMQECINKLVGKGWEKKEIRCQDFLSKKNLWKVNLLISQKQL